MVSLNIFAFLLYSLNRKNSVGLQDFKDTAFFKKIYNIQLLWIILLACWLYFLSRSRTWRGRKILSLSYWLFWKSDFSGSFQGEPQKICCHLLQLANWHPSLLMSYHSETWGRICKTEPWQSRAPTWRRGNSKARALFELTTSSTFSLFSLFFVAFVFFTSSLFREGWEEPEHALGIFSLVCATKTCRYPGARWSPPNPSEAIRSLYSFRPEQNKFLRVSGESVRNNIQLFNCMPFLIVAEEDMSTLLLTGTLWQWIFSPYIQRGKRQGAERPCKKSPCSYFHITNRW